MKKDVKSIKKLEKIYDLAVDNINKNKYNQFEEWLEIEGQKIKFTLKQNKVFLHKNSRLPDLIHIYPNNYSEKGCNTKKRIYK